MMYNTFDLKNYTTKHDKEVTRQRHFVSNTNKMTCVKNC